MSTEIHPPIPLDMTALVDEPSGPGQLELYYRISTPQGRVLIQPGAISSFVLRRSGLITCPKTKCDERFTPYTYNVRSGWNIDLCILDDLPNHDQTLKTAIFIWKHAYSELARLVVLELQRQSSFGSEATAHVLLRQDECLACSIHCAVNSGIRKTSSMATKQLFHIL